MSRQSTPFLRPLLLIGLALVLLPLLLSLTACGGGDPEDEPAAVAACYVDRSESTREQRAQRSVTPCAP